MLSSPPEYRGDTMVGTCMLEAYSKMMYLFIPL
ncbi:hypothetical protein H206_06982 [Candidatus Electrothrix aarhusensis]|uniref:Uncharacterized protein n=1 Tax=Candidatus Electrothrix aarhusensis TaxID=1859131 RepID=A0A3S3QLF8_9BACT|nr:hypothetical protein H206_06982 [Candidatus Electrothrix aarhusensis]